jgi:hypothetical protein
LTNFLDSGPSPRFFGFGSVNNIKANRLTDIVSQALELTG